MPFQAPNCLRSSFNFVAVRDCQLRRIHKPHKDLASQQIALEGQDLPLMYLAHHGLENVNIIIVVFAEEASVPSSSPKFL